MYDSYYSVQGILGLKYERLRNVNKSTSQYLFLNLVRIFSIIFVVLTIFYIPVYMGIGQINSLYRQQIDKDYSYMQKVFLQGTIFAIKKYEICYQQPEFQKVSENKVQLQSNTGINYIKNQYCYKNKLQFLPFVSTVQEFHTFYFSYFLVFYLIFIMAVVIAEYLNKKLYIELQYTTDKTSTLKMLQIKKQFHITCQTDCEIYFLKPLLKTKLQKLFNQNNRQEAYISISINLTLNQEFKQHAELQIKGKQLEQSIAQRTLQLKHQISQEKQSIIQSQVFQFRLKLVKLNWQKTNLQNQLQIIIRRKSSYHYNHFWIDVDSISDYLRIKKLIHSSNSLKVDLNLKKDSSQSVKILIDQIQPQNLIIANIQRRDIINLISSISQNFGNESLWQFSPNKQFKILNQCLQFMKIILGVSMCLGLIFLVDILILIIQKTGIFSYSTVLVVLILEIILKAKIVKFSQMERHSLYSHQKLSIMLKLTMFIFFNLVMVLLIANHDMDHGVQEKCCQLINSTLSMNNGFSKLVFQSFQSFYFKSSFAT